MALYTKVLGLGAPLQNFPLDLTMEVPFYKMKKGLALSKMKVMPDANIFSLFTRIKYT